MSVEPLIVYLKRNVGAVRAWRVALCIASWGFYSESLSDGEIPTMDGYVRYWRMSQATAYRERKLFRQAFPDLQSPEEIFQAVRSNLHGRKPETAAPELLSIRRDWAAL
jgi:hypothetical protein